jgi:hypothetical protein
MPSGQVVKISPHLAPVDPNELKQRVATNENRIEQGSSHTQDAARIAILAGTGASIAGLADRSWTGIGAGASEAAGENLFGHDHFSGRSPLSRSVGRSIETRATR